MPWTVDWRVIVDGSDVSVNMRTYLLDIEVTDKDGTASDTCSLTFDDTDGQVMLPKNGAKVHIFLQGAQVFSGTVDSVRSSGSRGGGRTLKMTAKGFDSRGKVKEAQGFHKDDATLQDFLDQAAKNAGLAGVKIGGDLGSIRRDYWAADGESFLQIGQKLARELDATFKIRAGDGGDIAVLQPRDRTPLAAVAGIVGVNVISWDIEPFAGRKAFTKAKVRYFDRKAATFKTEEVALDKGGDAPEATNLVRIAAADKDQAKAIGNARKSESERESGGGSVEMDLTVAAQAEAPFTLAGARPGVDGTYRITSVRHSASRSGGATTSLELKQPQDGAGKDTRGKSGSGSAAATPSAGGSGALPSGPGGFLPGI